MARKPKEEESVVVDDNNPHMPGGGHRGGSSPVEESIDGEVPLVNPSPRRPIAYERGPGEEVPPPPSFRVARSQFVMLNGGRTMLREGKIVSALNFDMGNLRSQGVSLEPL